MLQTQNPFSDPQNQKSSLIEGGRKRISPFIFIESLSTVAFLFAVFVFAFFQDFNKEIMRVALPLVVFVVVKFTLSLSRYFFFSWEPGKEELVIRQGLLKKEELHFPYEKIQSVNLGATAIQRIFGFASFEFTDASSKKIEISPLNRGVAELLKQEIYARKQASEQFVEIQQTEHIDASKADVVNKISGKIHELQGAFEDNTSKVKELYNRHLNHSELLLSSIGDLSLWLPIALSFTLFAKMQDWLSIINIDLYNIVGNFYAEHADQFTGVLSGYAVYLIITFVICYLVVLLLELGYHYLQHSSYMLRRHKNSFEITRGFFTQRIQVVSFDKIQGVMYKQTFLYKLLGYVSVHALVIEAGKEEAEGLVDIHPCIKKSNLADFLTDFTPELSNFDNLDRHKLADCAFRRACVRASMYNALVLAALSIVGGLVYFLINAIPIFDDPRINFLCIQVVLIILALLAAVIVIWNYLNAIIRSRKSWFAYDQQKLILYTSGIRDSAVVMSKKKLQDVSMSQTVFQLRAQVAKFNACVAGEVSDFHINDVVQQEALELIEWAFPCSDNTARALQILGEEDLLYEEEELLYAKLCKEGIISSQKGQTMNKVIKVEGMHCHSCEKLLASSLEELAAVDKAVANFETSSVELELNAELSTEELASVVSDCGFNFVG